jgi:hypothetical protein
MLSARNYQLDGSNRNNPYNVFHVLYLAYEVSLFPPGRGVRMTNDDGISGMSLDVQCIICNMLLLLPSLLLSVKVAFRGLRILLNSIAQIKTTWSVDEIWLLVDTTLMSFVCAMAGILCVSCFILDNGGSINWTLYNVRGRIHSQQQQYPIMRDLAAIGMFLLHFSAIDFLGMQHHANNVDYQNLNYSTTKQQGGISGIVLWHILAVVTIAYSSFVVCIINKLAPLSPTPTTTAQQTLRLARAWQVVIFGLRYSFLISMCGFAPSINAFVTLRLIKQQMNIMVMPLILHTEETECFLPRFGFRSLIFIAGFVTAFEYSVELGPVLWNAILFDYVIAVLTLVYVNVLMYLLDRAGSILGEKNFQMGNRVLAQVGAGQSFVKPSAVGCLVCGICSFLMLFIAMG